MPFLEASGQDIYYEDIGAGVPLILTAGGLSPATTMRPLVEQLASRYRVIIWDRPNQGLSQVSFRGSSYLEECAVVLRSLMSALDCSPAYLAAPSEGGRVAFRAALMYPEIVSGLFLWQVSAGSVADYLRESNYEQYAALAESEGMEAVTRTMWFAERIKHNPANRERLLEYDPKAFAAILRKWKGELREQDPILGHTSAEASSVSVPTAIVAGVDETHPFEYSKLLAETVPGATFHEAPYDEKDWHAVVNKIPGSPSFCLYAMLPGIGAMIDAFVSQTEQSQ